MCVGVCVQPAQWSSGRSLHLINKSVKKWSIVHRTVRTMFGDLDVRPTLNLETKCSSSNCPNYVNVCPINIGSENEIASKVTSACVQFCLDFIFSIAGCIQARRCTKGIVWSAACCRYHIIKSNHTVSYCQSHHPFNRLQSSRVLDVFHFYHEGLT